MKNKILLVVFISLVTLGYSQTFSFKMAFVDGIGNKDTLTFGYDSLATDTIDANFNEINICSVPLNQNFDVRVSNLWDLAVTSLMQTPFQTKRQILHSTNCSTNPLTIEIKCKHWPVTAYWDKAPFNDACKNGTLITSVNPGGWFDTGTNSSLTTVPLNTKDSVTFTSNITIGEANGFFNYLNNSGDTIPAYWFTFSDSTIFTVGLPKININQKGIYPNPTSTVINIPSNTKE